MDEKGSTIVMNSNTIGPEQTEAPIKLRSYFICAFAAFGGIFFGYDYGYTNGVMGMPFFIHEFNNVPYPHNAESAAKFVVPAWRQSLIVAILSVGTFIGSIISGDIADFFGRRNTIIVGCVIYSIGVVLQTASSGYSLLIGGRFVAGLGVGFESAIIILYMSEIAPRKIRGAVVSSYQFCITVGILLASCVVYGTQNMRNSGSYRIPIALQWVWALILGIGLCFLPESPRYFVKCSRLDNAAESLARLRGQAADSHYIQYELAEIVANHKHELQAIGRGGYLQSWAKCFQGSIWTPSSNVRRTMLGTCAQMFQQLTGIGFIFYFGTTFFKQLGTIQNPFLISLITTLVNVCSTPVAFWTVERFGRRPLLIYGAAGMAISQFIIAIAGTVAGGNATVVSVEIAFICIYIFFFASTWGPGAWIVVGEAFPLPIRARGVALSVASNWLWNTVVGLITPYMVNPEEGNLGAKVFFVWGTMCVGCFWWAYFLVYETKGLSLEQVDQMLEETTARKSTGWVPTTTFVDQLDAHEKEDLEIEVSRHEDVQSEANGG